MLDDELRIHLQGLEEELLHEDTRASREALLRLLDPDFLELGASGRTYDLEAIVSLLASGAPAARYAMEEFELLRLAPEVALVTYRLESRSEDGEFPRRTLRSSIWRSSGGAWRLRFHQGTLAP